MSNDLQALIARRKANTQIIQTFFRAFEQGDIDTWIALWAEDGVYLNPFTSEQFPQERISGRNQIASALQQMRDALDALQISGLKVDRPSSRTSRTLRATPPSRWQTQASRW